MTWLDAAGLGGVLLIVLAYGGAALGKLEPDRPASLLANLIGAGLILLSLVGGDFNLSAAVMEAVWALVALGGLVRWLVRRAGRGRS